MGKLCLKSQIPLHASLWNTPGAIGSATVIRLEGTLRDASGAPQSPRVQTAGR